MSDETRSLPPRRKGRPLLMAVAGAATATLVACGPPFISGNLIAPPCEELGTCEDGGTDDAGTTDGGTGQEDTSDAGTEDAGS